MKTHDDKQCTHSGLVYFFGLIEVGSFVIGIIVLFVVGLVHMATDPQAFFINAVTAIENSAYLGRYYGPPIISGIFLTLFMLCYLLFDNTKYPILNFLRAGFYSLVSTIIVIFVIITNGQ